MVVNMSGSFAFARPRPLILCAALAGLAASAHAHPVHWHLVAAAGAPAPGVPDALFDLLSDPRLNENGQVAFWASLKGAGVGIGNDGSIWSNRNGPIALIIRDGDNAPGLADLKFSAVPRPVQNAQGLLACNAAVAIDPAAPTSTTLAIFAESLLGLGLVEQELPINSADFASLGVPPFNNSSFGGGTASYSTGTGTRVTTKVGPTGPLTNLYVAGQPAPGTTGLNLYFLDPVAQNATDQRVFRASLTDKPVPTNPAPQPVGWGLFTDRTGTLAPIAKTGDRAPGTPTDVIFKAFAHEQTIQPNGDVVFFARLSGPGVNQFNDTGLWLSTAGGVSLIVREGDPVPGITGGLFGELPSTVSTSDAGHIAFVTPIVGVPFSQNSAVMAGTLTANGADLFVAMREGDHAPRMPVGVTLAGFANPAITSAGQLAVLARTDDPAIANENSGVLYVTDVAGYAYPIVATGDTFEINSATETVDEIIWDSGPSASGLAQANAEGEFVVKLAFNKPKELSPGAILKGEYRCAADQNADGQLTIDDFIDFQTEYVLGELRPADFDGNGELNIDDFIAFQTAFVLGC